jgi:dTDP-4-amino-4,6-dideoxygalactose transaminase
MINVTKTYLPPFEEYAAILKRAWDKAWITNNGELVLELEQKLKEYLGVKHLLFTSNGTVVLQMALKAFNITKEVITTPFSYVATSNVIVWEGCTPVFVDIHKKDFCIDADKIEAAITENTQAILATHVYGYPCDVEKIDTIATKHGLKVIYDGAHAFGCTLNGKPLLSFGDVSTCSFHATKLFHTVEGGCVITNDDDIARKLLLYRQFGHINDDYYSIGINGKNSEFHAAMGLAVLPQIGELIRRRKEISGYYNSGLKYDLYKPPVAGGGFEYNYSYYPVVFKTEGELLKAKENLARQGINTRRYFYPSLNSLPFLENTAPCPVSESISKRVLCLPSFYDLTDADQKRIAEIINNC